MKYVRKPTDKPFSTHVCVKFIVKLTSRKGLEFRKLSCKSPGNNLNKAFQISLRVLSLHLDFSWLSNTKERLNSYLEAARD